MKSVSPATTRKQRKSISRKRWSRNFCVSKRKPALWVQAGLGGVPKKPKKFMGHTKEEWDQYMVIKKRLLARHPVCPVSSMIDGKNRKTKDIHHIRGRAGSLFLDSRYMMAVSRWGHEWIAANPKTASSYGWLAGKGDWNRPGPKQ